MKKLLLSILLISLLLVAACTTGTKKTPTSGFVGGKDGIVSKITVESSSDNNQVLDDNKETFNINVNLENKGEYSVKEGEAMVTLDGINYNAFQIPNPTKLNEVPLEKLRKEADKVSAASQTIIQYDARYLPNEDADRTLDLAANVCYKYETISRVKDLCLRKQVTGVPSTTCKVDEAKVSENSGAPLQVTTLVKRPAGENKISVYIEAMNNGKGILYSKDYLANGKCVDNDKEKNKVYAKVELTEFQNSASFIKCSSMTNNEGQLNVIQNKVSLSCTIDTSSMQDNAIETPLRVTFNYVYKDGITTQLKIKSVI